jgi:hypothetical protein
MSRKLLCPACALDYKLHPQDEEDGFKMRRVDIASVKRPENLAIQVITAAEIRTTPVPFLVCDFCNAKIGDGSPAVAITMWREEEPEEWESEYTV